MSLLEKHNRFMRKEEHPNVSYIKHEEIGSIIGKALADLYLSQPENPLEYLGRWLINYSSLLSNREQYIERLVERECLQEKFKQALRAAEEELEIQKKLTEESTQAVQSFKDEISRSLDLEDFLDALCNYLQENTNATAAYIGIKERVKKQVTELDDENAHEDPEAPFIIRYVAASNKSEFIVGKQLNETDGPVSFSIWDAPEVPEEENQEEEAAEEIDETPKTVLVPDVINDPRIFYFDVPRLGSYLAVQLTYHSCLFESSYDRASQNILECRRQSAEQEALKLAGQLDEEEEPMAEIIEEPFSTTPIDYIIGLDTLGQDRAFTPEELNEIVDWTFFYKKQWERAERDSMRGLINMHLDQQDNDAQLQIEKETDWAEEEKNAEEESQKDLDQYPDEVKSIAQISAVLSLYIDRLNQPEIMKALLLFSQYVLVKHVQVFALAFNFMEIPKERVVEPGTNKIYWKVAKTLFNRSFIQSLIAKDVQGERTDSVPEYAKTMRLQTEISKINKEELKNYSLALFLIFEVIDMKIQLRILDVTNRRKEFLQKKEEKEIAVKAAEELAQRRQKAVDEAHEKYKNDSQLMEEGTMEPFNPDVITSAFDEKNPPVQIPEEPVMPQDSDIDWEEINLD